ncbi:MAG: NAD(P)/FAD-dependent oxidoreductase [Archaeoglobaceae archaeon]
MRVAVVGAGLTGLTAAKELSEYASVKVFEANELGGLLASFCPSYCVEKFYHHCFRGDRELLDLISELGLSSKLFWKTVKVGFGIDGRVYPLGTPMEILRYPYLSLGEKLRLALFTLRSRRLNFEDFDDVSAVDGIRRELGEGLLRKFFMPLLEAKFGENANEVSYAWLLARVAIRSNRKLGGEEIGYLRGGFKQLVERLAEGLDIEFRAVDIKKYGKWQVGGEEFDAVIYTGPPNFLNVDIRYQSSVCVLVGLEEPISNVYWINSIGTPFGAIIEHTNLAPPEDYGEHIAYLASYTTPDKLPSDEEVARSFLGALRRYGVEEKSIRWFRVFKARHSGPIYERGYRRKILPYRVAEGLYVAGMFSKPNYPERSMNGSVRAGREVAEVVKRDFGL